MDKIYDECSINFRELSSTQKMIIMLVCKITDEKF